MDLAEVVQILDRLAVYPTEPVEPDEINIGPGIIKLVGPSFDCSTSTCIGVFKNPHSPTPENGQRVLWNPMRSTEKRYCRRVLGSVLRRNHTVCSEKVGPTFYQQDRPVLGSDTGYTNQPLTICPLKGQPLGPIRTEKPVAINSPRLRSCPGMIGHKPAGLAHIVADSQNPALISQL
jgi:hypothetical protein